MLPVMMTLRAISYYVREIANAVLEAKASISPAQKKTEKRPAAKAAPEKKPAAKTEKKPDAKAAPEKKPAAKTEKKPAAKKTTAKDSEEAK